MLSTAASLNDFLRRIEQRDPQQPEFLQAVREVMMSLWPFLEKHPRYREHGLLERLCEPDRVIQFRWANWRLKDSLRRLPTTTAMLSWAMSDLLV